MPTAHTQTDVASFPTTNDLKSRWFFGLADEAGNLPSGHGGFATFTGPVNSEYDLVDENDIDDTMTEEGHFVVVLNRSGVAVKVIESSDSGIRILMHRGAYSLRRD